MKYKKLSFHEIESPVFRFHSGFREVEVIESRTVGSDHELCIFNVQEIKRDCAIDEETFLLNDIQDLLKIIQYFVMCLYLLDTASLRGHMGLSAKGCKPVSSSPYIFSSYFSCVLRCRTVRDSVFKTVVKRTGGESSTKQLISIHLFSRSY